MAIDFNRCLAYGCVNITLSGGSNQGATDVCDGVSQIGSMSRDWKKKRHVTNSSTPFFCLNCK